MAADPATSLAERLSVDQEDQWTFTSKYLPLRMGNTMPISYGGFQLGVAINAGALTTNPKHYLYSVTGIYLGPVSTESKITCKVEDLRSTRTFSTRQIRVFQAGQCRLVATADYRSAEEALLTFDTKPSRKYSSWQQCKDGPEWKEEALSKGLLTPRQAKLHSLFFETGMKYSRSRPCPEGIFAQNFTGVVKDRKTTQDALSLSEKATAEWYKIEPELPAEKQIGAVGFVLDGALSFLPLSFNNMFLDDAGACSSLDFALRVFSPNLNFNDWHLIERRVLCGSDGLTHSVANMFSEGGKLVAQMSQSGILRPKPVQPPKL